MFRTACELLGSPGTHNLPESPLLFDRAARARSSRITRGPRLILGRMRLRPALLDQHRTRVECTHSLTYSTASNLAAPTAGPSSSARGPLHATTHCLMWARQRGAWAQRRARAAPVRGIHELRSAAAEPDAKDHLGQPAIFSPCDTRARSQRRALQPRRPRTAASLGAVLEPLVQVVARPREHHIGRGPSGAGEERRVRRHADADAPPVMRRQGDDLLLAASACAASVTTPRTRRRARPVRTRAPRGPGPPSRPQTRRGSFLIASETASGRPSTRLRANGSTRFAVRFAADALMRARRTAQSSGVVLAFREHHR